MVLLLGAAAPLIGGCTSLFPGRGEDAEKEVRLRELLQVPEAPDVISEATVPQGLRSIEVDGVGLVNGLPGTGGPADPSSYRDQLIEEMKRRNVPNPNQFLEQDNTALVRVRATIAAGARRGDPIDLRILAPPESRVSNLHGGRLFTTRLRQEQVLQNMVRKSDVLALGQGTLITRADYSAGEDNALQVEGNVLGGGRVQVSRKLGLILRPEFQHAKLASALANAVNRRFFFFDGTTRRGIAKPLEDDFIELDVQPRYRDNIPRMMRVVRSIRSHAQQAETQALLTDLSQRLSDPATAADAAIELEALGESAVPTLIEGLGSSNRELRFYAAEALAYLDRSECVEPLEQAAREVAAFRYPALLALQGLDHPDVNVALSRLMNEPSIETRYGAFVSIRRRKEGPRTIVGKALGTFTLYQIPSDAPPAIVVSLREAPEIVMFGQSGRLNIPQFMRLPGGLMMKRLADSNQQLQISRFAPGDHNDQRVRVDDSVDAVIRGIVAVGGAYGDVIAALRTAKDKGYLAEQLAIDPTPKPLRTYYRE